MGRVNHFPPWKMWSFDDWYINILIQWLRSLTGYLFATFYINPGTIKDTPQIIVYVITLLIF